MFTFFTVLSKSCQTDVLSKDAIKGTLKTTWKFQIIHFQHMIQKFLGKGLVSLIEKILFLLKILNCVRSISQKAISFLYCKTPMTEDLREN